MRKLGRPRLDDLTLGAWRRHRQAILSQTSDVELDGLAAQLHHLCAGFSDRNAAWQVRHVSSPTRRAPLHPPWLGVQLNFVRQLRLVQQALRDADSPGDADANDAGLGRHVTTL